MSTIQTCSMPLLTCGFWTVACLGTLSMSVLWIALRPLGQQSTGWSPASQCLVFSFHYTLDMAICPYHALIFGMQIWHPGWGGQSFDKVDKILNAQVKVSVMPLLKLAMSGVRTRMSEDSQIFFYSTRRYCIVLTIFSGTWASKARITLRGCRAKL